MSSMLEQAIVDAAALREAALKNAEQAIIEKYAPQIKDAVESLLEGTTGDLSVGSTVREISTGAIGTIREIDEDGVQVEGQDGGVFLAEAGNLEETRLINEEEMSLGSSPQPMQVNAPLGASPESIVNPNAEVSAEFEFNFNPGDFFDLDLDQVAAAAEENPTSDGEQQESTEDLLDDLGAEEEGDALGDLNLTEMVAELAKTLLEEEEVIEEELVVDMAADKLGFFTTNETEVGYQQDRQLAQMEDTKYKEENEALLKRVSELQESLDKRTEDATKLLGVVEQLKTTLDEVLASNARLIYSNKTLSDASLNERQKSKIVEAIAQANSAEEAKTLHETLTATVGSSKSKGPQSLSESVNRKSNLSAILPRRKEKVVTESMSFADRMKKLAGIN